MSNTLSVYYAPWHWRQSDEDYIRRLQPAWIRIHQPTARAIHVAQLAAPNAKIMLRSWDIDDHNGDRKREMYADPIRAAQKHIAMWAAKLGELIAELANNGHNFDLTKWYMGLVNEPDPAHIAQTRDYSLEAMRLAALRGWRLGVVCSSVGNFAKPSEGDHGWAALKPLEQPIRDGGHILIVHEYWQPEGPAFVWTDHGGKQRHDAGNLAWRHHDIPLDVPILIGEAGANGYIYSRHTNEDNGGWQRYMTPEQYAAQVRDYIAACDSRVQGVCLYMTDYHSDQWQSFDTAPAHEALLAIADVRPGKVYASAKPSQPVTVHLPVVSNGAKPEQSMSNNWERCIAFVLRWEGGYANNPNDPGGETNWGITKRSYPQLDIANLTREQAIEIYRRDYWLGSGADTMPWPLCLAHFDTAVNAGVGRAAAIQREAGGDFLRYMALLLDWYTRIPNFEHFGKAWIRRRADLLLEASKA